MARVSPDELAAAGIYDPGAPGAAERLELLEHLAQRGASVAALVEAARSGGLGALASELALRPPGENLTVEEVAARSGTTVDRVRRVRLASGFPTDDASGLPPSAVDDVVSFEAGAALFGEAPTLSFTRVMGAAVAKVAEAAVSLFITERRPALVAETDAAGKADAGEANATEERSVALAAEEATGTFIAVTPTVMTNMLREHMVLAIRRSVAERTLDVDDRAVTVGIGFVDLVGSTAWASGLTLKENALALGAFETAAWEIASLHGGRVVKLIGDEAMFIAPTGPDAVRIAVALCRAVADDAALPAARGAVGYGTVGSQDGDYFGPLVNLVARAVKVADPGWVVVTEAVRSALGGSPADGADADGADTWEIVEVPEQALRGIEETVRLFAVR
jgi:adenylate cyclase